jgi:hypothetical protein
VTTSSTCVVAYVDQIAYTGPDTASKWFGGDDRTGIGPRSIGTGQSVTPTSAVVMDRFGLSVDRGFSYSMGGGPATTAVQLRLERRNSAGTILATYNVTVPTTFAGGYVYWPTATTTLSAGTMQIFTAWMTNAFANPVNSGSPADGAAGFTLGQGYTGQEATGNLTAWANWSEHPWDFHFRIQRRNASCSAAAP